MTRLLAAAFCGFFATCAGAFVWLHADRVASLGPDGERTMSIMAVTAILGYAAALILFASWRGSRTAVIVEHLNPGANEETMRLGLKAGVYGLHPGETYRVIREIRDYHGGIFPVGTELTFVQRNYLPYHGGHTVVFRPRPMYLQDETDADVLNDLESYLEVAADAERSTAAWRGY